MLCWDILYTNLVRATQHCKKWKAEKMEVFRTFIWQVQKTVSFKDTFWQFLLQIRHKNWKKNVCFNPSELQLSFFFYIKHKTISLLFSAFLRWYWRMCQKESIKLNWWIDMQRYCILMWCKYHIFLHSHVELQPECVLFLIINPTLVLFIQLEHFKWSRSHKLHFPPSLMLTFPGFCLPLLMKWIYNILMVG